MARRNSSKNSTRRPQGSKTARHAQQVEKITGYAFVRNSSRILVMGGGFAAAGLG